MGSIKIRRDKNAVAIFNKDSGSKIRLGIGKYDKATRPELVDIKITDACSYMCSFCYQGSTPDGIHSKLANMYHIADELKRAKVFEVAIGGGEPTEYPDFLSVLAYFRSRDIVPNFTTKSAAWVRRNWHHLNRIIGAFAYSADNVEQLEQAAKHFKNIPNDKINIHCVMGLQDRQNFIKYMYRAKELDLRVTLLGYKTTHRGAEYEYYKLYDWWIDTIGMLAEFDMCPTFSIDTTLAKQYEDKLAKFMPNYLYHTEEGKFSMYIDAVSMTFGASSYENLDAMMPFDNSWQDNFQRL